MEYKGYFYKEIQVKDYMGNQATMFKCSYAKFVFQSRPAVEQSAAA